MPGHQGGRGAPESLRRLLGERALRADTTQVLDLDDIHRPRTALKEAQALAARYWCADRTWFLVNGSSCGNHAMILSTVGPGDEIVVPRNAHRSVMAGLLLSGARPIYVEAGYDPDMGVHHTVAPAALAAALAEHPRVRAALFTSLTPYGAAADVVGLVQVVRAHGAVALADEAWGPHLAADRALPPSALDAGADLVVHSAHKLLPALSQASMLHALGKRVDPERVSMVLRMLQTTSPNCLLVASLDAARAHLEAHGSAGFGLAIALADRARAALAAVPGVRTWRMDDPTRLVFSALELGYTGLELERELRDRDSIQLEMSDLRHGVALVTMGHTEADVDRLVAAVARLPRRAAAAVPPAWEPPPRPQQSMTLRDAFYAPSEPVSLREAAGRTCAEWITPYPPGIPLLCPGEVFSQELVETLRRELSAGVPLEGPADPSLSTVRVVRT